MKRVCEIRRKIDYKIVISNITYSWHIRVCFQIELIRLMSQFVGRMTRRRKKLIDLVFHIWREYAVI